MIRKGWATVHYGGDTLFALAISGSLDRTQLRWLPSGERSLCFLSHRTGWLERAKPYQIFKVFGRMGSGKWKLMGVVFAWPHSCNGFVKLMTVFLFLLIQDWADISCPTPSPTGFWLGLPRDLKFQLDPTPYLESFICLFLLFRVYLRGAAAGLHQSYHPHSFVKCCYMFCSVKLMCKGVDIIFLSAHLMFLLLFIYFHTCILLISFKIWLKLYFIKRGNQSWITVQIALNLVCKQMSYVIC